MTPSEMWHAVAEKIEPKPTILHKEGTVMSSASVRKIERESKVWKYSWGNEEWYVRPYTPEQAMMLLKLMLDRNEWANVWYDIRTDVLHNKKSLEEAILDAAYEVSCESARRS